MIIKKFTAPTMREALLQVKQALGQDAVILKTRKVVKPRFSILDSTKESRGKRGLLDVLGREMVEITAATKDYDLAAYQSASGQPFSGQPLSGQMAQSSPSVNPESVTDLPWQDMTSFRRFDSTGDELSSRIVRKSTSEPIKRRTPSGIPESEEFSEKVVEDLESVKTTLSQIAEQLQYQELPNLPAPLSAICRHLIGRGVDERLVKKFAVECFHGMKEKDLSATAPLQGKMTAMISNCICESPMAAPQGRRPRVIAVVGPTGTGKTTTLVKMATNTEILGRRSVAFITADTYRIAAVEQLKTFAAIASIPVRVVYSPAEMPEALSAFGNHDYVLIDTAGRSQNHLDHLLELRQFMQKAGPHEIHLVVSATTKHRDLLDVIGKYDTVGADRLIFTKLDETTTLGTLVNIAYEMHKPIAFVTNGQSVPGDIAVAKANRLAELIMFGRYTA